MIEGSLDFSDLEEFQKKLESIDIDEMCKHITNKIASSTLKAVKSATPKGETQTLVRGWGKEENLVLIKRGVIYTVELRNNTEYAEYVEYGHRQQPGRYVPAIGKRLKRSWVPGQHFVLKTEIRQRKKVDKKAKAEAQKWIKARIKM